MKTNDDSFFTEPADSQKEARLLAFDCLAAPIREMHTQSPDMKMAEGALEDAFRKTATSSRRHIRESLKRIQADLHAHPQSWEDSPAMQTAQ